MPSQELNDNFVAIGLSSFNAAVDLGLTASQIAAAASGDALCTTIEGLTVSTDQADARFRAAKGLRAALNAGVLSSQNVIDATNAANIRAYFTAIRGDLPAAYRAGGFLS
jgi:hypothetical protein